MAREILNDETFEVCEIDLEDVANPDPEVAYVIRPISHAKGQSIRKRFPHENQAQLRQETALDHALVDWKGITAGGAPLPCERKYKSELPTDVVNAILKTAMMSRARSEEDRAESFRATENVG